MGAGRARRCQARRRRRPGDQLRGGRRAAAGRDHRDQRGPARRPTTTSCRRSRRRSRRTGSTSTSACRGRTRRLLVGKALGREEQAQKLIDDLHAKFEQVRKDHPEFEGKTAILAYGGPDGYGAYATQDTRSRFLADLGFKTPAKIDELAGKSFFTAFSQEQFRLMDQDVVVMYGAQKDVLANPVFKRLKAVSEDRVIYLDLTDQFAGALGFASVISLPFLLDESEDMFAAAVDGDPGTPITQPE